ncbi:hypothetical protein HDU85_002925 [Gaertneriomyces sp. JEL0708]|nr:hypothetical protein HDU85_002925 [Gaertneriomyces sp. JEL0708]
MLREENDPDESLRSAVSQTEEGLFNSTPTEGTPLLAGAITQPNGNIPELKPPRLLYLDHIRGLLMVLQSIDHSRMFLSRMVVKHEEWWSMPDFEGSLYHWFVRFLSAVCAPGFMATMGMSIVLFTMSRHRIGWNWRTILKHFFIRGAVLVAFNFVTVGSIRMITTVLFALGVDIFLGACIVSLEVLTSERVASKLSQTRSPNEALRQAVGFSIGCYCLAVTVITVLPSWYTPSPEHANDQWNWLYRLLFLPQMFQPVESGWLYSMYPPIPWLGMVLWGVALQRAITVYQLKTRTVGILHAALAVAMWLIFIPVRLNLGFGNINPGQLHPSPRESIINFFNLTKYPPSVAYTTCMLGLVHAYCALFILFELKLKETIWASPRNPLTVFGRSAFFFYVLHFYVFAIFRKVLYWVGAVRGSSAWEDQSGNLPDGWYWVCWLIGLAILYAACARYYKFKSGTSPESIFRFF